MEDTITYFDQHPREEFYYRFPEKKTYYLQGKKKIYFQQKYPDTLPDSQIILDEEGRTLEWYKQYRQQPELQMTHNQYLESRGYKHLKEGDLDSIPDSQIMVGPKETLEDWKRKHPPAPDTRILKTLVSKSYKDCVNKDIVQKMIQMILAQCPVGEWDDLQFDEYITRLFVEGAFLDKYKIDKSKLDQLLSLNLVIKAKEEPRWIDMSETTLYTDLRGGKYYVHDSVYPLFMLALIADVGTKFRHCIQETCSATYGRNYHCYLDIESFSDLTDKNIEDICVEFNQAFRNHHEYHGTCKPYILHNHYSPNRKFHIFFPEFITSKTGLMKTVNEVLQRRPEWKIDKETQAGFIDPSMSGLRLPYQYKPNNSNSIYLHPEISEPTPTDSIQLFFVTRITAFSWEVPIPMKKRASLVISA